MNIQRLENGNLLWLASSLLALGCGDDGAGTQIADDAGKPNATATASAPATVSARPANSSSASTDASQPPREGPEGCYRVESHACDCSLDEAACDESGGVWTEGCTSCGVTTDAGADAAPSPSASGDAANPSDAAHGDAGSDASSPVSSDAGEAPPSDAAAAPDATTSADAASEGTRDAATPAAAGCYDPVGHTCACGGDEASCVQMDGIWTDACACF